MPRSRSRKQRGSRRRSHGQRVPDSFILIDLLKLLDPFGSNRDSDADLLLPQAFGRATWSFHRGPGPRYAGPGLLEHDLARLRAREWFLFEFELPSGLTAAEEWTLLREGEPGSAGLQRSVTRLVNGTCGLFDVRDVRPNGWMLLAPLPEGDAITARPIERSSEMVRGSGRALPVFHAGDTIAGRLYRLDDERAELSAGACVVSAEARSNFLADPPPSGEPLSGLALEALLGADASVLLSTAADPCYSNLVDDLLWALSDGTFGYHQLWRELDREADPVPLGQQLLWELREQTFVESELLAQAVAGTWFRRKEAEAGRAPTAGSLARERRALEGHVRRVLDMAEEPAWPASAAAMRVVLSDDDKARIAGLEDSENEWIVDVLPAEWRQPDTPASSAAPLPIACAIVESAATPFDAVDSDSDFDSPDEYEANEVDEDEADRNENGFYFDDAGEDELDLDVDDLDEDDEAEDDEDETSDGLGGEGEPVLVYDTDLEEGEDEAAAALRGLVAVLTADDRKAQPERIVFRQRALAARLGDTLREAGFDVALRYFTEAVDAATLDAELRYEEADETAGAEIAPASDADRRAYARLCEAADRAQEGFQLLAVDPFEKREPAFRLTLAEPFTCPFTTFEGIELQVGSIAVGIENVLAGLSVRVHLAAPGEGEQLNYCSPDGSPLIGAGDTLELEIGRGDKDEEFAARFRNASVTPPPRRPWVLPQRFRYGWAPALLRGRELEMAAGIMEAAAEVAERVAADEDGPIEVETRVEPLGQVTVRWSGWPWASADSAAQESS